MTNTMTNGLRFANRLTHCLIAALFVFLCAHSAQAIAPNKIHAIWVYPDLNRPNSNPVLNAAAGQQLIANASASHVNMIYLSVYSSTPNSNQRYMYDETLIANFVRAAGAAGMSVYAAYGDPAWPTLGCGTSGSPSFPISRIQEAGAYNAAHPSTPFTGVILDVEPATADQSLLTLYACSLQTASQYGMGLSAAISAFWTNPIGSGPPAYQQILNMAFNNVVIMGYRNLAGTFGANDNSILALDTAAVAYKNSPFSVLVGLETQNMGTGDPQNNQSFYGFGQVALDYQAQSVWNQFAANGLQFAGFAIDNYADAYLGGTANWPASDSTVPTGPGQSGPAGVATSKSVTTGGTTVTVTVPNNLNSNSTVTVTPVNPVTESAPTGFQLTSLAFDVSTTAVFTGSATVCFTVPSLDAATFASLRILHYIGGVAYDQTILGGPNAPNVSTQTICASVYSFSPFVLAKVQSPLAAFSVQILSANPRSFLEQGRFALSAASPAFNPATQAVTFSFGAATVSIPAGSFFRFGTDYLFVGAVKNVFLTANLLEPGRGATEWTFGVAGFGLDITGQSEPMKVALQVGNNTGSTTYNANVRR